ncbi:MAG TPA: phosphoribosyltransferase [Methanoregulaceae archaeon]|nr:phosphoribosyltransferase [Methanoregulaceae archaeon]
MDHDSFPVELISWKKSYHLAKKLSELIRTSGYQPEIVIAIGRGGYVPARVVCDYLLIDRLTSIKIEHWGVAAEIKDQAIIRYPLAIDIRDYKVLVIDDVTDTGETLQACTGYLEEFKPGEIRTGVLQHKISSSFTPDYFADLVRQWHWIVYPWAIFEDMTGFCEKILTRDAISPKKIINSLESRFGITIDEIMLDEILQVLVEMGRVIKENGCYRTS